MASEMLYPIMPIYLKQIGFSILLIGILEGIAEATAGLSKGYFGKLSDLSGKRVPFVQFGYALSALSKPMMAIFIYPLWIFFSRTIDRIGKGVRSGARDALLSDESTKETKGKVFGFHRSMDTFGAFLGPILALGYLYLYPNDYKTLFFIAFIPGVLSVIASFYLKEKNLYIKNKNRVLDSIETKIKKSIANKGKRSQPIEQYDIQNNKLNEFISITEACISISKPGRMGDITACCRGKQKTAFGFIWKYKNK